MKMTGYNLYALHPGGEQYEHVGTFETLAEVEAKIIAMQVAYTELGFRKLNVRVKIEAYILLDDK